ncbi:MAG TPA: hypothetical protein VF980_11045 [Thermoanaerobaculia bacterium]
MKTTLVPLLVVGILALVSCEYTFPLAEPTQHVDKRLLGDYTASTPKREWLKIRRLDDKHYVVVYDGTIFRAHHSDVNGMPLVSLENIDDANGKWTYLSWQLSELDKVLTIRNLDKKLVPYETTDAAATAKLLIANRDNPTLFGEPIVFRRN